MVLCINYPLVGDLNRGLYHLMRACYTSTISYTDIKIESFKESVEKLGEREGGLFMD